MATSFNWTCPTCGRHTTITSPNHAQRCVDMICAATDDRNGIEVWATLIECPNPECRSQSFSVKVNRGSRTPNTINLSSRPNDSVGVGHFTFLPTSPQPLSIQVPGGVVADYNEAYLIAKLSPKASATLARRALQGMVRDFFQVSGMRTLHAELEAIKPHCDASLYGAMMAVKSVGNIGAHPEQDVNLIVDVEPGEAETLLQLIHLLDREWYVARADRLERIGKMNALAANKAAASAAPSQAPAAPSATERGAPG